MAKEILFLTTGGTIASVEGEKGLSPEYNSEDLLDLTPEINNFCKIENKSLMEIDSANMQPECWLKIGKKIYDNYHDYDAFVITHGTDTMAYTSAALSYILKNLDKPVIITGAQRPIKNRMGDAQRNIIDAFNFACEEIPGVFIVFNGKVINGTRASKVKSKSYDSFKSINYPYVAEIKGSWIKYTGKHNLSYSKDSLKLRRDINKNVFTLKLFPGIDKGIFSYIANNYNGVIIETYGIGGLPFRGENLLKAVKEKLCGEIPVIIGTQCLKEGTDLSIYEVGLKTAQYEIIEGKDMTTEALTVKLMVALEECNSLEEIKEFMYTPVLNDIAVE